MRYATEQTSLIDHTIEFLVDMEGSISGLLLDGVPVSTISARIFCVDSDCKGFLRTTLSGPFNQIQLAGSLIGNSFSGDYLVDEDDIPPIESGDIALVSCP